MAGIGGYYYIGNAGGFLGSDGLNGKDIEIEIWHGDRKCLVANYLSNNFKPISTKLRKFVPHGPEDKDEARIALILFASNLFVDCPSYNKVKIECEDLEYIDFSSRTNVPPHFNDLLEESKQIDIKDKVYMYESVLNDIVL